MRTVSLALGLTLALAGCSSQDGANDQAVDLPSSLPASTPSAIDDYLGIELLGNVGPIASGWNHRQLRVDAEDQLGKCMSKQGFEYTSAVDLLDQAHGAPYGTRDWAAKYGFGVSTLYFSEDDLGEPKMVGYADGFYYNHNYGELQYPNEAYYLSLNASNQLAYREQLGGVSRAGLAAYVPFGPNNVWSGTYIENSGSKGCWAEATERSSSYYAFQQEFRIELRAMVDQSHQDPRIVEKLDEVAACVSDTGHKRPGEWLHANQGKEPALAQIANGYFASIIIDEGGQPDADRQFVTTMDEIGALYHNGQRDGFWHIEPLTPDEIAALDTNSPTANDGWPRIEALYDQIDKAYDELDDLDEAYYQLDEDPNATKADYEELSDKLDAAEQKVADLEDQEDQLEGDFDYQDENGFRQSDAIVRPRLIALQQNETSAATATFDCGGSPGEMAALYRDVLRDHEAEFVEKNKLKLDAFKTALAVVSTASSEELPAADAPNSSGVATNWSEISSAIRN